MRPKKKYIPVATQVLSKVFYSPPDALAKELPSGYFKLIGKFPEVDKLLAYQVIGEYTKDPGSFFSYWWRPWPGPEEVNKWYELQAGFGVAWIKGDQDIHSWQFIVRLLDKKSTSVT
jgi:hypothetical protein